MDVQVTEVGINSAQTLVGVIAQIFDKALLEPTFCELYAQLCEALSKELRQFEEDGTKVTFKRVLLNKCQEEFERGEKEQAEAEEVAKEGEAEITDAEREKKRTTARKRMLGNIRFVGELYRKGMLTERIMHDCIKKLLGDVEVRAKTRCPCFFLTGSFVVSIASDVCLRRLRKGSNVAPPWLLQR